VTARSHDYYEELVVGHALSALEPEDEQELLRHLPTCAACERDLAEHQETLAHLAYAGEVLEPPPSLWDGIAREVTATSGPAAFAPPEQRSAPAEPVGDLAAARERRSARARAARLVSAAAAAALVLSLGVWNVALQRDRDDVADRLASAVQMLETGPGQTVPLAGADGRVTAVAVVHQGRLSLVVDGLRPNDVADSTYVLWGQSGSEAALALATFDVRGDGTDVLRDLPLPVPAVPELFVLTEEPGRTAPAVTAQPALATGRPA
jgi:anti-sigma factor RsiW